MTAALDVSNSAHVEDWRAMLKRWRSWQQARGHSAEHTIGARLRRVEHFAAVVGDPVTATTDDVVDYLASLDVGRSTLATYYSHLRAWFKFLVATDVRADDPSARVPAPRVPRRKPRGLTDEQLCRLLDTRMHRRTRMMVLLAAFQGLRVHEIAKIRGEDVDLAAMQLRVEGKGGTDYTLPLHPVVAAAVLDDTVGNFPRRGWWFTTHNGNSRTSAGPILARSVSNILSKSMDRAGIDGGPHRLRHTYATRLVGHGVNIRVVQELLRHASLQTTQIYTGVTFDQQKDALGLLTLPS